MKKIILSVGTIVISIIVGIIAFKFFAEEKDDVSLTSFDNKASITFEEVTKEGTYAQPGQIGFKPDDIDNFYDEYIKNSPYYLYSLSNNSIDSKEEIYVLFKDEHYFFLKYGEDGCTLYDGMRGVYTGENAYYTNVPYMDDLAASEVTHVCWSDSVGMTSYEDLLEYYRRLDDSLYEVNDEERIIYLSMYNVFEDVWIESGVKLKVTDMGFDVNLMSEYAD